MDQKQYYVYILTKARNSTFYVGVTSDLLAESGSIARKLLTGSQKNMVFTAWSIMKYSAMCMLQSRVKN